MNVGPTARVFCLGFCEVLMVNNKLPMSRQAFEKLTAELDHLKKVERPLIIAEIAAARAQGDLSENAEYHAAKEKQGMLEDKISELEDKIRSKVPRLRRLQRMDELSQQITEHSAKGEQAVVLFPMLTTAAGTVVPARVFVVGAAVAGKQSGKIFIENGRFHGPVAIKAITHRIGKQ